MYTNDPLLTNRTVLIWCSILFIPICAIVVLAFLRDDGLHLSFSVAGFKELLKPLRLNELLKITARALAVSVLTTCLSFALSYLLVLHTSRSFRMLFLIAMTLPFFINESVRIFSWQYILAEDGLFNRFLSVVCGKRILLFNGANQANVYLMMMITCMPFGVYINAAALEMMPAVYWKSAADLKIKTAVRFLKIAIPLSAVALMVSLLIIFFISFSLSSEVNYLGGDSKISMRNLVLSLMSASKFEAVFALGTIMILLLFLVTFSLRNRLKDIQ